VKAQITVLHGQAVDVEPGRSGSRDVGRNASTKAAIGQLNRATGGEG